VGQKQFAPAPGGAFAVEIKENGGKRQQLFLTKNRSSNGW
jgi:hypothetical protein